MSVHGLNTEDLERRIAARISSLATSALDAFVICSSTTAEAWQGLGDIDLLIPSLATHQVLRANGTPLVLDESCLHNGPWAGLAGSTGEQRLAELEGVVRQIRKAGGVVIGIGRSAEIPDINLERVRVLYDLRAGFSSDEIPGEPPRIVQNIFAILNRSREKTHG